MTVSAPTPFNFTPEQRKTLADAYRLILSWRQKRIRAQATQPELTTKIAPTQSTVVPVERKV